MGTATPRQYGGVGITIERPVTVVEALRADRLILDGLEGVDEEGRIDVEKAMWRLCRRLGSLRVRASLLEMPSQHVGLGTKTSLVLATLKAVSTCLGVRLSTTQLQEVSGRGGASGIGIHSFFLGGLLIDGGHPPGQEDRRVFRPSGFSSRGLIPPLLSRVRMPEDWRCSLLVPEGARISGRRELNTFERLTPVPTNEILEVISVAVMGLAASAAAGDFMRFGESLRRLGRTGFKAREIQEQPGVVGELLSELNACEECAAGMSSMGPLVFVVSPGTMAGMSHIETVARRYGVDVLSGVKFWNSGSQLQVRW